MKKGEFYLNPIGFFIILGVIIIILSFLLNLIGFQANYVTIGSSGELESSIITVNSLLNGDGFIYIISNAISNFALFTPLTTLIVALIGIGVAVNSGFLNVLFNVLANKVNRTVLTFILIFIAVLSSIGGDIGYVILIPLGALLFIANKRNPLAAVVAIFAGITGGNAANLFVGGVDSIMASYTSLAAGILDPTYEVGIASNLFLMITAVIGISLIGTYVTEKTTIPRFGRYEFDDNEEKPIYSGDIRGLLFALIGCLITILITTYCIIPGLPGSGILLDPKGTNYITMLLGYNSYFYQGLVTLLSFGLVIAGLLFMIGSRTFKLNKNVLTNSLTDISGMLVLFFFVAQALALFKKSNIGNVLVISLLDLIKDLQISSLPLIVLVLLIVALAAIFVPSTPTKWMMMSPVLIPLFMQANMTAEFGQMIYRVGDSITRGITPILPYFAVFLVYLTKYNKRLDKPITVLSSIKMLIPYQLYFALLWIILILAWYIIGLPLGPNVYPTL